MSLCYIYMQVPTHTHTHTHTHIYIYIMAKRMLQKHSIYEDEKEKK